MWRHARGLAHAFAWNELLTAAAKYWFQRERPFHDTELVNGTLRRIDDRASFYSGRSSHIFTFATYMSAMARDDSPAPWAGWAATAGLYGLAGWVASARAIDGQHNWSDVVVGSLAGTGVAFKINWDVEELIRE